MGNWSEQQDVRKDGKEKDKVRREKLAGYFFDLSKLAFAGLVISIILPLFSNTGNATNVARNIVWNCINYIVGIAGK